MRNYSYIYESAQIENFERQILSGHLTEAKLIEMYENNQLSEQQIKVVEELFGGIGNIGRAIGGGLKSAGQAVGQAIGNQAKKIGSAAAAGAQQVGKNVRDIYQSGEAQAAADKRVAQLNKQLEVLDQLLAQHVAVSPNSSLAGKNLNNITLGQLKGALKTKAAMAGAAASAARQQGFTGGVGGAIGGGYNA